MRPRWRTATVDGKSTRFKSCHFDDTFWLHMDAVAACQEAGTWREGAELLVDGRKVRWR